MFLKWFAICLINYSIAAAYSSSQITEVLLAKCSGSNRYTMTCFKLDFLRLMSLLGENTRLPLGPGVALVGTEKTRVVAEELDSSLVAPRTKDQLNHFIMTVVEKYLGSLNLTVQLKDSAVIQGARSMVSDVFEGRMKKARWAFLWTLLAILFAVMAGLSGSALVASMIALILSSVVVLRAALGGGAGFGAPPSGFGYALPISHTTASGRITAYDLNPEVYMDDNSHSASGNVPMAYAAYSRQAFLPMNASRPLRPT